MAVVKSKRQRLAGLRQMFGKSCLRARDTRIRRDPIRRISCFFFEVACALHRPTDRAPSSSPCLDVSRRAVSCGTLCSAIDCGERSSCRRSGLGDAGGRNSGDSTNLPCVVLPVLMKPSEAPDERFADALQRKPLVRTPVDGQLHYSVLVERWTPSPKMTITT